MAHVLIVDDDPALLQALPEALRLRMEDIVLDTADSGPTALQLLERSDYDAVVCDIKMPGMDGLAVLEQIRQLRPSTPTLLITGHGQHDLAVQALRGGAYDFIQKPIERDYFVASLQRAINMRTLSRKVEQQRQELLRHAEELQQAVEARTRELREANQAKDQFLATLAHELRNPLASIRNAIAVLEVHSGQAERLGADQPVGIAQACNVVQRQVAHMARLLDDLLDISRIQHGKVKLERRMVELGKAVAQSAEVCTPFIQAKGHEFAICLHPSPLWIDADPTRLEQIVVNLLNNAVKYTQPGGRIVLAVQAENGHALLRVSDSGVGIDPTMLERIFDMFTQAEQSLDRAQGGLGIGLTLVRYLVNLHGGTIWAQSKGVGHGSEFTVRLPLLKKPPPTPALGTDGAARTAVSRHVLVVEDNDDSRRMMAELLRLWGHRAETAADGPEAIDVARRTRPEVALVDIGLPGLDGFEVARRIRTSEELSGIYLVALTGYGGPEDRRRGREAGFDNYVIKPINPEELRHLLDELPTPSDRERPQAAVSGQ
jgi:signal transduction histidine kinase